jgi:hypothetical protein
MNGIGINLEVLQPFIDALDQGHEVIRFDVPGTGGSPARPISLPDTFMLVGGERQTCLFGRRR